MASTGIPSSEEEVEGYLLEDKWKNNFDSHANADRPIDRRQTTQTIICKYLYSWDNIWALCLLSKPNLNTVLYMQKQDLLYKS
jgi:hypothetical protein